MMFKFFDILFRFAWPFDLDLLPQWCIAAKAAAMQAGGLLGPPERMRRLLVSKQQYRRTRAGGRRLFGVISLCGTPTLKTRRQSFTVWRIRFFNPIHLKTEGWSWSPLMLMFCLSGTTDLLWLNSWEITSQLYWAPVWKGILPLVMQTSSYNLRHNWIFDVLWLCNLKLFFFSFNSKIKWKIKHCCAFASYVQTTKPGETSRHASGLSVVSCFSTWIAKRNSLKARANCVAQQPPGRWRRINRFEEQNWSSIRQQRTFGETPSTMTSAQRKHTAAERNGEGSRWDAPSAADLVSGCTPEEGRPFWPLTPEVEAGLMKNQWNYTHNTSHYR